MWSGQCNLLKFKYCIRMGKREFIKVTLNMAWHAYCNHFYSLQREVQKLNIPLASVSLVKCLLQISSSFQVWSFKARQVYLAYSLFQTEAVQGTLRKYSTKYKSTRYKEQWIENEMTLKQLLRRKMIIMTINKIIEK